MRFKAIEIANKPFIQWDSTDEPLGSLVVNEEDVPEYVFGICPLKIVDGELVERDKAEMNEFEEEWNQRLIVVNQNAKLTALNNGRFDFNGEMFPMNEVARWHYLYIERNTGKDHSVVCFSGKYTLVQADIAAFLAEFWGKLENLIIENYE